MHVPRRPRDEISKNCIVDDDSVVLSSVECDVGGNRESGVSLSGVLTLVVRGGRAPSCSSWYYTVTLLCDSNHSHCGVIALSNRCYRCESKFYFA